MASAIIACKCGEFADDNCCDEMIHGDEAMAITLAIDENLAAALEIGAKENHLTLEQFAVGILARAVESAETATPDQVVAKIRLTPPNRAAIRHAEGNLGEALRESHEDPCFTVESWTRQWSQVEEELKAVTRKNDVQEGRG